MKTFIIYTTQGATSGPNIETDVENCQVLGTIQANNSADAINELFEKNEWIHNAGFTKDYVLVNELFPSSIKKDIKEVIDFIWEKERKHSQGNTYLNNNIFRILKRLEESL